MKNTAPRAALFWSGFGYGVAALDTQTEIAGPFETLHEAFKEADRRGMQVVTVQTSRGLVKHPSRKAEKVA